jgi:hypothetical protein
MSNAEPARMWGYQDFDKIGKETSWIYKGKRGGKKKTEDIEKNSLIKPGPSYDKAALRGRRRRVSGRN